MTTQPNPTQPLPKQIATPAAQSLALLERIASAVEAQPAPTATITVAESSRATLDMISPTGVPVTLSITKDTDTEEIIAIMDRADKIGAFFRDKRGWAFASTQPAMPTALELAQGPTFCGYPCSPTVDDRGLPSWLVVDGRQAMRHEKQGDVWWSVKAGGDKYEQVLRIPKGEKAPQVKGL